MDPKIFKMADTLANRNIFTKTLKVTYNNNLKEIKRTYRKKITKKDAEIDKLHKEYNILMNEVEDNNHDKLYSLTNDFNVKKYGLIKQKQKIQMHRELLLCFNKMKYHEERKRIFEQFNIEIIK